MESMENEDLVNNPAHYMAGTTYEVLQVLRAWGLSNNFALGNAIKYIARADKKGSKIQDLKKAVFYINHEIEHLEQKPSC
jgi:Protein of unknwon function (DUF3310)